MPANRCVFLSLRSTTPTVPSAPSSPPTAPVAMAVTTVPPSARSASPCSATSGPPTSGPGGAAGSGGSSGGRCCDTGRPIFTDPISGQTVCSCQYDLISYQRLASAGIAGPGGVPLSMYSAPYSPETMAAYFPAIGADQAPFYANPANLKHNYGAKLTTVESNLPE
uniref:Uncharacterized protein n=1 Tax=Anopheles christyi TaxID=43041 RepID=A0A182JV64_9DIPT